MILNRAKGSDENDKERLRELGKYKYRNLSEEEEEEKIKDMGRIDIVICLKKKKEIKRI